MNTVKLKNSLLIMMLLLVSCLLVACNSDSKVKATFTGTIETVNENGGMLVNVEEATDTKLEGLVDVDILDEDILDDTTFNVGDKVKVGFNGMTFEKSPVMVQAITLEKIE